MRVEELLQEAKRLPLNEKWRLVKEPLHSLETEQMNVSDSSDWHTFLRETYGSMRDTPDTAI